MRIPRNGENNMTYIFISPNYPAGHCRYIAALRNAGHTVLGIGDAGSETFSAELRGNLDEYYRVGDIHNYDELYRAVGYYINHWGRIDRIESLNPYWADTVASLRAEFTRGSDTTEKNYRASLALREKCTLLPECVKFTSIDDALSFGEEKGYPLLALPLRNKRLGVRTIAAEAGLRSLLRGEKKNSWLLCALHQGSPISVDGFYLTDSEGEKKLAACTAHAINPDGSFYSLPADDALAAKAMELAELFCTDGFFHIDAVKLNAAVKGVGKKGEIVFNRIENTPPHEVIIDCMNAEFGCDLRALWASGELPCDEKGELISLPLSPILSAGAASRSFERSYKNSHEKILRKLNIKLLSHGLTPDSDKERFSDYFYVFSGADAAELKRSIKFITEDFVKCQ